MPIWSEILAELAQTLQGDNQQPDFDGVRRKYLFDLKRHTGRDVILYASGWLQKENAPLSMTSISDEDMHALMEVSYGLQGPALDIILHSPGGATVAAEAVVSYLRSRFSHIRVIVPQLAMSAATMIACASDEILMGKHSLSWADGSTAIAHYTVGYASGSCASNAGPVRSSQKRMCRSGKIVRVVANAQPIWP